MEIEIDYSEIQPDSQPTVNKKWTPPRHVYFGPKDSDGSMLPEPVYQYQEFPRILYIKRDNKISAQVAKNEEDKASLIEQGYVVTLAELGYLTAPSYEEIMEMKSEDPKKEVSAKVGRPKKEV